MKKIILFSITSLLLLSGCNQDKKSNSTSTKQIEQHTQKVEVKKVQETAKPAVKQVTQQRVSQDTSKGNSVLGQKVFKRKLKDVCK